MYDKSQAAQDRNRLGILCIVTILAVLAATLWPFNPFPRNRVRWLTKENGIDFKIPGLVIGRVPFLDALHNPQQSFAVELLLRPAAIQSLSTILNFYTPDNPQQFLVRQWTDGLLVSCDVVVANGKISRRKIDIDHAFEAGKLILVTIVSGPNGTVVYTDGQEEHHFPKYAIPQSALSGQIVVGNSAVNYEPWVGQLRGLAIYSNELTREQVFDNYKSWTGGGIDHSHLSGAVAFYSFTELAGREIHNAVKSGPDLEIPEYFEVPHKARLSSPVEDFQANWEYVKDVFLNIAGFIPLGVVLCAYLMSTRGRGRSIAYTIVIAATLSFMIEVLQAFIPRRNSGTTDVITNTLGAALGAALAGAVVVRQLLRKLRLN